MADYLGMDASALKAEQMRLQKSYDDFKAKGLKLDMSRGKPGPEQLELSMDLLDIKDYKDESGLDTRNYGGLEGTPEAREFFAQLLGAQPQQTVVGGSSSLSLMYSVIDMGWRRGILGAKPWKDCEKIKFLCPSPGYDRHFRITEDFGFELIIVPMTADGPDMDVVEKLVQDEAVKGMWCVPVYSNPDGYVYSDEVVRRMASMKTAADDFLIMWDNAYMVHHLTDTQHTCANILSECSAAGNENRAVMFCSTSKVTFAGAGVSAVAASEANIDALKKHLFPMLISYDKMNQLRHVRYLKSVGMAQHMKKHAEVLAPKFKQVEDTLCAELGECGNIARWTQPKGGYFTSLYVMDGCAKRVVQLCKEAGVVLTGAGAAFPYGKDPNDNHIRIAPSYPSPAELEKAAQVLCIAVRMASIESLLAAK